MPRERKLDKRAMLEAARLASMKARQHKIAEILGISPSAVSKLLKKAMAEGYLQLQFLPKDLSEEEIREIEARIRPQELKEHLHRLARDSRAPVPRPEVRVFESATEEVMSSEAWSFRLEQFGQSASSYIQGLLLQSEVCGVSWGETLASVVRALDKPGNPAPRREAPIHFVPLCGEALDSAPKRVNSSSLAHRLDEIMNGPQSQCRSLWLAGVPALVPDITDGFTPNELAAIQKYIRHIRAYREIFGEAPGSSCRDGWSDRAPKRSRCLPWIERLDTILTSVGPAERPLGYGGKELLKSAGLTIEEARHLILGDISGILIKRPDLSAEDRNRVDKINERWTGIKERHLRRCAEEATRNGRAGVVLVAIGSNKAPFVYEAVKLGLANHLVVDQHLASALQQEFRAVKR